jgi:hypothetical protein
MNFWIELKFRFWSKTKDFLRNTRYFILKSRFQCDKPGIYLLLSPSISSYVIRAYQNFSSIQKFIYYAIKNEKPNSKVDKVRRYLRSTNQKVQKWIKPVVRTKARGPFHFFLSINDKSVLYMFILFIRFLAKYQVFHT